MRLRFLAALAALQLVSASCGTAFSAENSSFQFTSSDSRSFYDGYDEARRLSKAGEYPAAIKKYEEVLTHADTASKEAMVHNDLAKIYHILEDPLQEIAHLEKAIRVTPDKKQKEALATKIKGLKRQGGLRAVKPAPVAPVSPA